MLVISYVYMHGIHMFDSYYNFKIILYVNMEVEWKKKNKIKKIHKPSKRDRTERTNSPRPELNRLANQSRTHVQYALEPERMRRPSTLLEPETNSTDHYFWTSLVPPFLPSLYTFLMIEWKNRNKPPLCLCLGFFFLCVKVKMIYS